MTTTGQDWKNVTTVLLYTWGLLEIRSHDI
jgi:hypothetical protein